MEPPYIQVVSDLMMRGMRVGSRYGSTREKVGVTVRAVAGSFPGRPRLNPRIGLLEGLFLVGEVYNEEAIRAVAPNADHSLFTERGAYGPRIEGQLENLIRGIERDPSSRQHVLHLSTPNDLYTSDMPCTVALDFLIRQSTVDCFAFMRSSDVIKGLPTDILQFGILTQVIGHCFDYLPRYVHVVAASHHLYMDDVPRAPVEDVEGRFLVQPMFAGTPLTRYRDFRQWARDAVAAAPWESTDKIPRGIRVL